MLKKLYTTKMSDDKKVLENRFSKISSKNIRAYKIAAIAVGAVIVVAVICANIIMSMVGNEESEINEISENNTQGITDNIVGGSFAGKVLDETTEYMIVEPRKDKPDISMGDKVKVLYESEHLDYYYGIGRNVVVYFEGNPTDGDDGMKTVTTDDISTEGFREFELEVKPSTEKQKKMILSSDDIQSITSFGHLRDSSLYYYGLDKVQITIKGWTMPLVDALEQGRITLHGLIIKANRDVLDGVIEELSYDDGGSQVYKYPDYTIIKYHTLEGNEDIYIGSTDMGIDIATQ